MDRNVGAQDRTVRLVLGAILAVVGIAAIVDVLALGVVVGAVALVVGLVLLVTGATQTCPAYQVTGISTLKRS